MPQKQFRHNRSHQINPFDKYLKPEDHLHIQVCRYIRLQYPGATIHHSPNEGKRSPFERYLFKVLEVSAGFPDLLIIYRKKVIAIELKAGKNKPTDNQTRFLSILNNADIPAAWFNDFEAARAFIDAHFK